MIVDLWSCQAGEDGRLDCAFVVDQVATLTESQKPLTDAVALLDVARTVNVAEYCTVADNTFPAASALMAARRSSAHVAHVAAIAEQTLVTLIGVSDRLGGIVGDDSSYAQP